MPPASPLAAACAFKSSHFLLPFRKDNIIKFYASLRGPAGGPLATRRPFATCRSIAQISAGNVPARTSSTENIRGNTLGVSTAELSCLHRHLPRSFRPHGPTPPMSIPRRRTSRQCQAVTCLRSYTSPASRAFEVDSYLDEAVGTMTKNARGTPWVSSIALQPTITYGGEKRPDPAEEARLHHEAHEQCFIAQSIKTEVTVRSGCISVHSGRSSGTDSHPRNEGI